MRTLVIIIFLLLTFWSLFGFDQEKPFVMLRYGLAYVSIYPLRLLGIIAYLAACIFLFNTLIYKKLLVPATQTYNQAEKILNDSEQLNAGAKTIKGTYDYMKITTALNTSFPQTTNIKEILNIFIDKSRQTYGWLPEPFRVKPEIAKNFYVLPNPTQIYYFKVKPWNHTILLFLHQQGDLDKQIIHLKDFDTVPTKAELINDLPTFPKEGWNQLLSPFYYRTHQNYSYYPVDSEYGVFPDNDEVSRFIFIAIPEPASKFDYNKILKSYVGLLTR